MFGTFLNQLTGTIPSEIGLLSDTLIAWSCAVNSLTGELPSEIGLLTLSKYLAVNDNSFSGTIPTGMMDVALAL